MCRKTPLRISGVFCFLFAVEICAEPQQGDDIEEVLVIGSRRSADYSIITEDTQKLVDTAGALGDPLGAVFALPGVVNVSGQEPAVRGSSPNDNAFIVDFLPASYIFHEFGVSVFSEYILQDFQLYSAGFGPEYNNVTGAVFDVRLRDPANQALQTTLDISMLRSGIFLESGLTENSAFYLSARRSLIDLFIPDGEELDDGIVVQKAPQDSDYQFKYIWTPSDKYRLTFSANGAGDAAAAELTEDADFVASNPDFTGDAELENQYHGQSLVWQNQFDDGSELTLGVGFLQDESEVSWGDDYLNNINEKQTTYKARYRKPLNTFWQLSVGTEIIDIDFDYRLNQVLFICTEFDSDCDSRRAERINVSASSNRKETASYADLNWTPNETWSFNLGFQRQENDLNNDRFTHPRLSANWRLTDQTTLSAKYGRYNRFADLETILPETGNPTLASPEASHTTLGVLHEFGDGWSVQAETYYKELTNLPRALEADAPNADLRYTNDTEGEAIGIDLMLNKNLTDKWYGWMSLSYAESTRTDLLENVTRDYFLDTPLVFNWVLNYQWRPGLNLGFRWSVRSGQAYTDIIGVQEHPFFEDRILPIYAEPYGERLPFYMRLDLRAKWDLIHFGKEAAFIVDILNATNHDNISERNLDYDKVNSIDDPVITVDEQELGFTPVLSYRITF